MKKKIRECWHPKNKQIGTVEDGMGKFNHLFQRAKTSLQKNRDFFHEKRQRECAFVCVCV